MVENNNDGCGCLFAAALFITILVLTLMALDDLDADRSYYFIAGMAVMLAGFILGSGVSNSS